MIHWCLEPSSETEKTEEGEESVDGLYTVKKTETRTEVRMQSQSWESKEQVLVKFSDSGLVKEFEQEEIFETKLEPSAPYVSPADSDGVARSSSYENLYQGISHERESFTEPLSAQDIGDRFDTRQTEPHLKGAGRSSSFEDLYAAGVDHTPATLTREGESAGPAASAVCLLHGRFILDSQTYILLLCMSLLLCGLPAVSNACVDHHCRPSMNLLDIKLIVPCWLWFWVLNYPLICSPSCRLLWLEWCSVQCAFSLTHSLETVDCMHKTLKRKHHWRSVCLHAKAQLLCHKTEFLSASVQPAAAQFLCVTFFLCAVLFVLLSASEFYCAVPVKWLSQ